MVVAGVGLSQAADSLQAAGAALEQALTPFAGEAPAALLCFTSVDRAPHLAAVREVLIAGSGCGCVVGCTGSGVIAAQRELEVESAIVVAALGGEGVRATPFHDPHFYDDNRTSGHRAAMAVEGGMGDNPLLIAFLDPFSMAGTEFLTGVAELAGRLPVVGGAAADDGAHGATYQMGPAGVTSRGACGLLLSGVASHQVYLSQACHPLMAPEMVTSATGSRIDTIDDRPAMAVLGEVLRGEGIMQFSAVPGRVYLAIPLDPTSATLRPGEYTARDVVGVDPESGAVFVADEVVTGQAVSFALRDGGRTVRGMQRMVTEAAKAFPEPAFALYVDCRGRGRGLYRRPNCDAAIIGNAFPHLPLAGIFSYAELGPVEQTNRLHNYAGVLTLLG